MFYFFQVAIIFLIVGLSVGSYAFETAPSENERDEISQRLRKFYQWPPKASVMDESPRKYDAATGRLVNPNSRLRIKDAVPADLLLRQAQAKANDKFQEERCTNFLQKRFPELKCKETRAWESTQPQDQIENLAQTWISSTDIAYSLAQMPVRGGIKRPYWSGDYWSMRAGLTSYRYSEGIYYSEYRKAVAAYAQPKEWEMLLSPLDLEKIASHVIQWSPAEKYDLMTGNESFPLTNEQKYHGERYVGEDGNVEGWFGICHGWAPASVFVAPPVRPVTATGARGVKVTWYPDDIRAMVTLAWANGQFRSNFVGGRCNAKDVKRLENGRIAQSECFDSNPATFHGALGNLIGREEVPFIMDAAFDYQVWNQPVLAYEFEYFNPLDVNQRGSRWDSVSVPYDSVFKQRDRFQKPKTRGLRLSDGQYDDSQVRQVVGVIATVTYLSEVTARYGETPRDNNLTRVTYTYDLELHEKGGELVALGGEWHSNVHPDFLWVPRKGAVPESYYDHGAPKVYLDRIPSEEVTNIAGSASRQGYPLCQALAPLVEASAQDAGTPYLCP